MLRHEKDVNEPEEALLESTGIHELWFMVASAIMALTWIWEAGGSFGTVELGSHTIITSNVSKKFPLFCMMFVMSAGAVKHERYNSGIAA